MHRILIIAALTVLLSAIAFGNIANPDIPKKKVKPSKAIDTTLSIRLDRDAKEARLIIPRSQLKQLRAELEQLDSDEADTAAVTSPGQTLRTQTIVSGLFLSFALIIGGMWFARSGKAVDKTGKTLAILLVAAVAASTATLVFANAGPPSSARSITGKMFSDSVHMYGFGYGKIKLETGDDDRVELIVPDPQSPPESGE